LGSTQISGDGMSHAQFERSRKRHVRQYSQNTLHPHVSLSAILFIGNSVAGSTHAAWRAISLIARAKTH
jgi:hypothetical protein